MEIEEKGRKGREEEGMESEGMRVEKEKVGKKGKVGEIKGKGVKGRRKWR